MPNPSRSTSNPSPVSGRTAAKRPTLRDVANEADVSFKTVSRVVNDEGGVSQALTHRVEAAVATLGYRPDHRARLLRQTSDAAATIGFVMPDVSNEFFSSILRGIETVAETRNCLVLAGSTGNTPEREHRLVDALIERRVSGLMVVSWGIGATLWSELDRGTPVVFLDIEPEPGNFYDLVRSDHRGGAETATRHLLDRGHTRIAYFGDDMTIFSGAERLRGYHQAMAAAGIGVEPDQVVTGSHSPETWTEIIVDHLTSTVEAGTAPTALFTAQNFVTIGAVRALHQLGLRQSVAHVGFDDINLGDTVDPGVSVVPQRPRELGRLAAELLFARLDGLTDPPVQHVLSDAVIERGSGEIEPSAAVDRID